jgi:hypothetical protein
MPREHLLLFTIQIFTHSPVYHHCYWNKMYHFFLAVGYPCGLETCFATSCYSWSSDFVTFITFLMHSCTLCMKKEHICRDGHVCLSFWLFTCLKLKTIGLILVKCDMNVMTLEATPNSYCLISKVALGQVFFLVSLVPIVPPMLNTHISSTSNTM